ncbi:MAG: hypothetical protein WBO44_11465 [Saprospiraceae bacterium]
MNDGLIISGNALQRHFDLEATLYEFTKLFKYNVGDDRAIVIIGASFVDIVLEYILLAFFLEDDSEVSNLLKVDQPLGTFGNRIKIIYCLGLIDKVIKDDLKLVGKIRSWCKSLKWHKESLMMEPPEDATTRDLYQVGVNQLITHLNGVIGIARGQKRKIRKII